MESTPLDFQELNTYSVYDRYSKVSVDNFAKPVRPGCSVKELFDSFPDQLLGSEFPELIDRKER